MLHARGLHARLRGERLVETHRRLLSERALRHRQGLGRSCGEPAGEGERYLLFLALYDGVFAVLSWASFEYVVTE